MGLSASEMLIMEVPCPTEFSLITGKVLPHSKHLLITQIEAIDKINKKVQHAEHPSSLVVS